MQYWLASKLTSKTGRNFEFDLWCTIRCNSVSWFYWKSIKIWNMQKIFDCRLSFRNKSLCLNQINQIHLFKVKNNRSFLAKLRPIPREAPVIKIVYPFNFPIFATLLIFSLTLIHGLKWNDIIFESVPKFESSSVNIKCKYF